MDIRPSKRTITDKFIRSNIRDIRISDDALLLYASRAWPNSVFSAKYLRHILIEASKERGWVI
jgi:hypothetical protein